LHLQSQLLEREAELEDLDAAIDAARRGAGRLVIVEGPAGIGKSRLLAVAGRRAQERGLQVLVARGGELEREFAYGIVRQLFEPAVTRAAADDRQELLGGLAGLTAPLFVADTSAVSTPAAGEDAGFAMLHGLYWLAVNLAERQPLALVVDDLHWGDGPSLRWLTYLLRRIDGLAVLVLVSVRPDEPGIEVPILTDVLPDPAGSVLRPAPLSLAAVTQLVRDALGPDAAGAFCAACHQASGGNPFLLRELLGALAADRVRPTTEAVARVRRLGPQPVARVVRARLARLPREATRLAQAVAVLGDGADLGHAAALASLEREQAAHAVTVLGRAQLLRPELPCRFLHPVVRAAIYDDLPLSDREHAHAQAAQLLAEHGAPAEQVCAHLLLAPPAGRAVVITELRQAARQALAQGAADTAAAYLRRALQEPPAPTERAEVLYELGSAERLLHAPTATHHLGEALALTDDWQRRGQVALALGQTMFFSGQGPQAVDVLDKAIADLGHRDTDLRHRLEAALLNVAIEDPTLFPLTAERLQGLRRQPPPDLGPGGRALLAILAYQQARAGTARADAIALAQRAASGGLGTAGEGATTFGFAANVLAHADQFDTATAICEQALADARARSSLFTFALASLLRGHAAYLRGALAEAEADARQALEAALIHGLAIGPPYATAKLAEALLARGDLAGAASTLDLLGLRADVPDTGHLHWFLHSRARLRILQGRVRDGLADLLELGRRFQALGGHNPAIIPWRSEAALALLQLGDRQQARRLAAEEVELAHRWAAPRALGRALRAAGLTEGGADGLELLREATDVLGDSPALLEHAGALIDFGAALRRTNRRAEARTPLREGLALAHRCGAAPLQQRAHDELLAAGARPRRLAVSGVESLTPSEQRIAAMAAQPMTNREIAQALFVTPKTVEMHLNNVFRKLDISSRSQLLQALSTQPAPHQPVVADRR
jgi:DNA-binding CsgD family transcriptional regulator